MAGETNPGNPEILLNSFTSFTSYFSYGNLFVFGHIRDFIDYLLCKKIESRKKGYKELTKGFDAFYRRRLYDRIHTCWNRPICSNAGPKIEVMKRQGKTKSDVTGEIHEAINISSYNYLGFATPGGVLESTVLDTVNCFGISTTSAMNVAGRTRIHADLENIVSDFLDVEDSMIFGMGWATNVTGIPTLIGSGCLVISDSLNHNSIVTGCRASGAKTQVFKHNNFHDLEKKISKAIRNGQPRTRISWKKILIIIEGIYSMEGEISPLSEIISIKKKYKCYLFLDEAHSVGAMGKSGKGLCDYSSVSTKDVDILMGTFTKSFGAIGGYIAGKSSLIHYLRQNCASQHFSAGLSPVCAKQTIGALELIMGRTHGRLGLDKIDTLHVNSNWLRGELKKDGFVVLGETNSGSAVIPVIIGDPGKLQYVSQTCFKEGLAIVVVGFPATPLLLARVRFCLSASLTRKDIKRILEIFKKVGRKAHIRYNSCFIG